MRSALNIGWKPLVGSVRRVGIAVLGVLAAAALALWALQEQLVFAPPPTPVGQGHGATRVDFVATDSQPLFGWLVLAPAAKSENAPHRLILHFHGNGDLADSWIDWAREVAERTGWSVFLAEYRGYGGLPGRPTYERVMEDAEAAVALLQSRYGVAPGELVLYGHSLGTGVATQLAFERGAQAVLLEAPITSMVDVGRRTFGPPLSWILPFISRIHFAPRDRVRSLQAPVWVVCGDADEVAPAWMARSVFAAALRKGELLLVPGAGHGDVAERGGEQYWRWLREALGG